MTKKSCSPCGDPVSARVLGVSLRREVTRLLRSLAVDEELLDLAIRRAIHRRSGKRRPDLVFDDRYFMASNELNLLNTLLLAKQDDDDRAVID